MTKQEKEDIFKIINRPDYMAVLCNFSSKNHVKNIYNYHARINLIKNQSLEKTCEDYVENHKKIKVKGSKRIVYNTPLKPKNFSNKIINWLIYILTYPFPKIKQRLENGKIHT